MAYSQRERGPIRIADDSILNNHERIKNYFAKAYVYPTEGTNRYFSARQYNNAGEQREVLNRMGGFGKETVIICIEPPNKMISHSPII